MARFSFSVLAHTCVAATIFAACAGVPAIQTVQFQVDQDDLDDPRIDAKLDDVIAALERDPDLRLMVVGHADEDNTDEYNLALSQRRAARVRARLIERAPKYASRVETTGRGEWDRLGDGVSEPEKAKNRRVEFVFFYPRVCEPVFGPELLTCEAARLTAPEKEPPTEREPEVKPKPPVAPEEPPNRVFTGGFLYGTGGYAIGTSDFVRQYGEWGVGGGYVFGWDRTFRIAVALEVDHLIDAGFVTSPSDCTTPCESIERSQIRFLPDFRLGAARGRLWAYARFFAGPMMQHQERQAIEEDGMQTVLGPEQWRAGGNFGLGPGFVLTLWRGLFLGFDFGVSYSILQGLDRGTGIFDARLSLGWFFTKH